MMTTKYRITEKVDGKIFRDGLVLFRNGIAYAAAPSWSFMVGRKESDVLDNCKRHKYAVEKKDDAQ